MRSPLPWLDDASALLGPARAFLDPPPSLGRALGRMLIRWTPPALAGALGSAWSALRSYEALRAGTWAPWERLPGLDPELLRALRADLPAPPPFVQVWPWLVLALPLGLLGTWFHHAVWDHAALWMLGGLKAERGFRASLLAEAQALRVAALGTLVGLLGFVPGLGVLLALPLLLLEGYLWVFRGFALAARHGCEPWRGVAATLVHAALLGALVLGTGLLALLWLRGAP